MIFKLEEVKGVEGGVELDMEGINLLLELPA